MKTPGEFPLPQSLTEVLHALAASGSRPFLVGGCVRDWLFGLPPKDFDIEVFGATWEALVSRLQSFGRTDLVGKSFGVAKLTLGGKIYDFSLPRRETKAGSGHRGFSVEPDPNLTERQAALRRDFTLNAILYDPLHRRLVDPLGGLADLDNRLLRHTGPAFAEDPLRVLRGFQLAARFDLALDPETARLCGSITDEFQTLPRERIWGEWEKFATLATKPSRGLDVLRETGWLEHFPEISALVDLPQDPVWHPEGDVFTHTAHCLDALVKLPAWLDADPVRRRRLALAVLAHDFGKATTTNRGERRGEIRWISPGHESAGRPLTDSFLTRIGAPTGDREFVPPLVVHHLYHISWPTDAPPSSASVRRMARKLTPATIDDLCVIMLADNLGRPPKESPETITRIETLKVSAARLQVENQAPQPILKGRHLIQAGLEPGPSFKPILDAAFEAQLDGTISDEHSARLWLAKYRNLSEHKTN